MSEENKHEHMHEHGQDHGHMHEHSASSKHGHCQNHNKYKSHANAHCSQSSYKRADSCSLHNECHLREWAKFRCEVRELHREIALFAFESIYRHLDAYFGKTKEKDCKKADNACKHDKSAKGSDISSVNNHHEHEHGHSHSVEHGHDHDHSHTEGHDLNHDHSEEHDHNHSHSEEHGHDHDHSHTEGHDLNHDHSEEHDHDHPHVHSHDESEKNHDDHSEHSHDEGEHHHDHSPDEEYTGITTHDESIVGSIRRFYNGSYAEAVEYMKGKVKAVADKVGQAGGIIGHIKGIVRSNGDSTMLSVTDDESDSNLRVYPSEKSTLELASIVFKITEEQLLEILKSEFGE